ncbi:hypothetical protein [Mycoplasma seminis]|uniref:Uncharacterized protein n=1 Tax=Mycoplasma seminis TaxID=512749 RepID=A0ABY9H9J7_9MOLU|nr:hypothetical protein [Mycoplasma seminis]WLP85247.1 hypothetical protein Q8852_02905 [Mycoplasma seminis]
MNKLKLPNFGELGIDIKECLWNVNPDTYHEFYIKIQSTFRMYLYEFMKKRQIPTELEKDYEQILLYMSFVNYKKEKQLMDTLNKHGHNLKPSNTFEDMKYKIDLKGTNKHGDKIYIQVKPKFEDMSANDATTLYNKAVIDNATPYIACKKNNIWKLKRIVK